MMFRGHIKLLVDWQDINNQKIIFYGYLLSENAKLRPVHV